MDGRDRLHLAIAGVAAALILATWWLMSELDRRGKLEQCLMARRRDCARYSSP
ncbi:hypothetical protein [Enterovirga aerilata]|uniref:Transmembrane protein n=1 Tax=Enterovirga aerilata TaxID=2730920 RepID=A0A849I3E0_9HYPH|nr:hypothetical protein [Enterovirga sp. DB1703]NNM71878.1 hypothetical protein [Enterovirga sp. DB1703]